jgi:chloramphenicol-sensitive protein RarD
MALLAARGGLTLPQAGPVALGALAVVGLITTVPLLLFAYAAKRIPLSTLGMGQYIVPSAHFLLAIAFGEAVNRPVLAGFGLIWLGLAAYSIGGALTARNAVDARAPR